MRVPEHRDARGSCHQSRGAKASGAGAAPLGQTPLTPLPFAPTVLEARVRQLQAECVSEVTVKRVGVARLRAPGKTQRRAEGAAGRTSGRWAQKLDEEKWTLQKRKQRLDVKLQGHAQPEACERALRVLPRLLDARLACHLELGEPREPHSRWEEKLARLLHKTPREPSRKAEQAPQAGAALARLEVQQHRLLAFLDCCLRTGHLPLAHHVLVTHHSRARQQQQLTLAMYNVVLLGWARKVSGARGVSAGLPSPLLWRRHWVPAARVRALLWPPWPP